jgi:hypothetical protein
VASEPQSEAPRSAKFQSWYGQAAYKLLPTKFEGVVRYTDFNAANTDRDQRQWALGVNYLFANNVIGKLAYEFNRGEKGEPTDANRFMLQFAYGF